MDAQDKIFEIKPEEQKSYESPMIIHEIALETRAGSPLGFVDPLDLEP